MMVGRKTSRMGLALGKSACCWPGYQCGFQRNSLLGRWLYGLVPDEVVAQEVEWQLGTPLPCCRSGREDPCSTTAGLIES